MADLKQGDWTDEVEVALEANIPANVVGPPGIGKTAQMEQVAGSFWRRKGRPDAPFVGIVASISDPTDATGLLAIVDGKVVRSPPNVMGEILKKGYGTFFIDEMTTAPSSTQAAYLRVLQERVMGDTPLPPELRIVIACNPPEIAAGGNELSAPFANRLMEVRAKAPSVDKWGTWITGAMIDSPEARKASNLFAEFVKVRGPEVLFNFPEDEGKRSAPWPSPRSMHNAAKAYAAALKMAREDLTFKVIAGCAGSPVATEFAAFIKDFDLPNPRDVLDGKVAWKPERHRIDRIRATIRGVVFEAVNGAVNDQKGRAQLIERAWELVRMAYDEGAGDVMYVLAAPLNEWRARKSGQPMALGPVEAQLAPRFFQFMQATK